MRYLLIRSNEKPFDTSRLIQAFRSIPRIQLASTPAHSMDLEYHGDDGTAFLEVTSTHDSVSGKAFVPGTLSALYEIAHAYGGSLSLVDETLTWSFGPTSFKTLEDLRRAIEQA